MKQDFDEIKVKINKAAFYVNNLFVTSATSKSGRFRDLLHDLVNLALAV